MIRPSLVLALALAASLVPCRAASGTAADQDARFASAVAQLSPQSLTLAQAEAIALANHPQIGAADARALAARQEIREARSGFFPQVTADAEAVGVNNGHGQIAATGGLASSTMESRQSDGLAATQLITDFGHTASLTQEARLRAGSAEADIQTARAQVLLRVDQAYFEVLEAQAVVRVADETVQERSLILERVGALAQAKLKSDLDASFARVDLGQAKLLQLQAANELAEANARLANALGYSDQRSLVVAEATPFAAPAGDLDPLLSHAFQSRPELAALTRLHEADVKDVSAQKASELPTIQAIGAAGVSPIRDAGEIDDTYAAAGINIGLPILTGGRLSAQVAGAEAKAVESQRLLEGERNDIARDVRVAWLGALTAFKKEGVAEDLLANASQALDLAQARYQSGISSIVELSQAQLNKTQAEIDVATARYDYQILAAALKYQLGDFQ